MILAYLARRGVIFAVSLAVASVLVFVVCEVLPGDPAAVLLDVRATPESLAALRHQLGTDRPLLVRYLSWVGALLTGDFGISYVSQVDIATQLAERLEVTVSLVGLGMLLALVVAVPVGGLAALGHRRWYGTLFGGISQLGMAVPAFWAGIVLSFLFAAQLRLLPANGYVPLAEDPLGWAVHLILPTVSLALVQSALLTRYVRSAVLEVAAEDYVRTARAAGRTRLGALWHHGRRNAAIPVVTVLGLQLTTLLVGAIVVESVYTLPGLGLLLLQAVADRDLLVVQGVVIVLVAAVLAVNLLTDLAYLALDPRLRVRK